MIEPAAFGAAVVFGPHVWNFKDTAARLTAAGGAYQVAARPSWARSCCGCSATPASAGPSAGSRGLCAVAAGGDAADAGPARPAAAASGAGRQRACVSQNESDRTRRARGVSPPVQAATGGLTRAARRLCFHRLREQVAFRALSRPWFTLRPRRRFPTPRSAPCPRCVNTTRTLLAFTRVEADLVELPAGRPLRRLLRVGDRPPRLAVPVFDLVPGRRLHPAAVVVDGQLDPAERLLRPEVDLEPVGRRWATRSWSSGSSGLGRKLILPSMASAGLPPKRSAYDARGLRERPVAGVVREVPGRVRGRVERELRVAPGLELGQARTCRPPRGAGRRAASRPPARGSGPRSPAGRSAPPGRASAPAPPSTPCRPSIPGRTAPAGRRPCRRRGSRAWPCGACALAPKSTATESLALGDPSQVQRFGGSR